MIGIIDYGAGNLNSVEKAFLYLGYDAKISNNKNFLSNCDKIVLPGVGSFGECMQLIRNAGFDEFIYDTVNKSVPFLGICLGMQLLFDRSEEGGDIEGLGILKGKIVRLPDTGLKIPQIGWNKIRKTNRQSRILNGIDNEYFYFVHSYYLEADSEDDVCAKCEYGKEISIACEKGNIFATQFHPEKSSDAGLKLLKNFCEI